MHAISRRSRSPACCGFRGVFWVRRDSWGFVFCSSSAHAASMRPPLAEFNCLQVVLIARAVRGRLQQTRDLWKRASMDIRVMRYRRTSSRDGRGRRSAVNFVVCSGCGGISFFCLFFSFEHTRLAASMIPPCFFYLLPTSTQLCLQAA